MTLGFPQSLFRITRGCAVLLAIFLAHNSSLFAQSSEPLKFRVSGVVTDQAGNPVTRAEVTLNDGSLTLARAQTDEDGRFSLGAHFRDAFSITVAAEGFARWSRNLGEGEPKEIEINITLRPAPISEQVTVTATRTETRLGDTPASVRIISAPELSTTAATTLDDALRQVPGFSLFRRSGSRTANPTSQGVSLRGVGASGASRALVLADRVPLNDPFGGWVYWSRVPRSSVESVEVLRGGASHLYGSSALGGVVNISTRRARSPVLSLEASYGDQQTVDVSLFAGGRKGLWGASLAAASFHTGGYIIVDERERGLVDTPAGARSSLIKLTLERSLSKTANLFASASFFGEARANGTRLQINRTHIRQFVIGGDWQSKDAGTFSLRTYGGTQVYDQTFSAVGQGRETEALTRVQRVPAQSAGLTVQWSRAIFERHTIVAGLEGREVRGASDEQVFVSGRVNSLVEAGGRERSLGVFVEDIISLTQSIFITAGARIDRWRNFAALSTTRPLAQPATTRAFPDRAETAFSPYLSALYKPAPQLSLYLSATRAFRAPTLNELYRSFRVGDVLTLANENLTAERLTGVEAGASSDLLKQKLNVRANFFWSEITKPVANVTLGIAPGLITRQRQNLGSTRSRGLEAEFEGRPTERLSVSGGYLFADAIVRRFPANSLLEGLRIPQVPRHQLTLQARYVNPSLVTIGLQARASGSQLDDDQNRFRLDKYFTLDAHASRRFAHGLEAFIAAENIFDTRYDVGLTPVRTIGPPLLVRIGFRLQIGSR